MTNPDPNTHIDVTVHVEGPFARWRRRKAQDRAETREMYANMRTSAKVKTGRPRNERQLQKRGSDWLP